MHSLPLDISLYFSMFFAFNTEILIAMFLLTSDKKGFRTGFFWKIPLALVLSYGASVGVLFLGHYIEWNVWTNVLLYTIIFVVDCACYLMVYKVKWKNALLLCMVAYTMQHMTYQVSNLVLDTGLSAKINTALPDQASLIYNIILVCVRILCYVGLYFALVRLYIKNCRYIFNTLSVIALAIYVYAIVVVANAFAAQNIPWWNYWFKGVISSVILASCILFDILIVGGFKFVEKKEEATAMQRTMEAQLKQYEMTEQNIAFINMKCHDLRKEIRHLKEHRDNVSLQELNSIEESLRLYDTGIRTGVASLDILIQDKQVYCTSHGIEFTALIDGNAFSSMPPSDVYFLMVNIIDNAIEAVENIPDTEKRIISMTVRRQNGLVQIEELNYFNGPCDVQSDGTILSHKGEGHGFGTKSISYIIKKHHGQIRHEIEGDRFGLKIVL
ncbi:MAG: GHKL domain-containing protein [Bacilli bacterium]|nr:GHKL domain-containing protein [Bacilli bacterium]